MCSAEGLTNKKGLATGGGPGIQPGVAVCQADEEEGGLIISELKGSRVTSMTGSSLKLVGGRRYCCYCSCQLGQTSFLAVSSGGCLQRNPAAGSGGAPAFQMRNSVPLHLLSTPYVGTGLGKDTESYGFLAGNYPSQHL